MSGCGGSHLAVRVCDEADPSGWSCAEYVDVRCVLVMCGDGTLAMLSPGCTRAADVLEGLRTVVRDVVEHGLAHVEPRVEP